MKKRMRRKDLFGMFWRCFLVQGSWNYQSMLGLGFCFSALPFIQRFFRNPHDLQEGLRRHLNFFNAHPYFASWCLGAVAKLEEEAGRKKWTDRRPIEVFKERLMGPLGAIGDQLFWNGIKPAAAGLGVWLALTIGWMAIPIFLVVYNVPHLLIRFRGLRDGYRKGFDIVSDLSMRKFQKWVDVIVISGSVITGLCIMAALQWSAADDKYGVPFFVLGIVSSLILLHYRKSVNVILMFAAFVVLLFTLVR